MARPKYHRLDKEYAITDLASPSDGDMRKLKESVEGFGLTVTVGN